MPTCPIIAGPVTIIKTIEYFYGFPIHFLFVLFVRFFKHEMAGNFNGTISNMK